MNESGPSSLQLCRGYGSTILSESHRRQAMSISRFGTYYSSPAGPVSRSLTIHAVFRSEARPHSSLPEDPPRALPLHSTHHDGVPQPQEPRKLSPEVEVQRIKKDIRNLEPATFDAACVRIADRLAALSSDQRAQTVVELPGWIIVRLATDGRSFHLCARLMFRIYHELAEGPTRECVRAFGGALVDACRSALDTSRASVQPETDTGQEPVVGHNGQRQWTWTVKFIGELCKLKVMPRELVELCFDRLFHIPTGPTRLISQEAIEIARSFLIVVGPGLEEIVGKKKVLEWIGRLESWLEVPDLSSRSRFIILDVLEISCRGWKTARGNSCCCCCCSSSGTICIKKESETGLTSPPPPPQQQQQQHHHHQQQQQKPLKISEIRHIYVKTGRARAIKNEFFGKNFGFD